MGSEAGLLVHRRSADGTPQMAETLLERHAEHEITPNEDFFVVHHYEPPPAQAVELGHFDVRTRAGATTRLTVEDLKRFPAHRIKAVVECAGNGRQFRRHKAPGTQFGRGVCGIAVWEGARLADVLESCGVEPDFKTLVAQALDAGWVAPEFKHAVFGKGLPREKALHPDTLIAWSMNGEPLPWTHGGPVRLVVPGWCGIWWVKWISELSASDEDYHGFWQHERYRYKGGDFEEPVVVREQLPRALVLAPSEGQVLEPGAATITGKAWSGLGRIARVEVSTDGGTSWEDADLVPGDSRWGWDDWSLSTSFDTAGAHLICARATDESGARQEWDSRPNDLGYGNNEIMVVTVRVQADVRVPAAS